MNHLPLIVMWHFKQSFPFENIPFLCCYLQMVTKTKAIDDDDDGTKAIPIET
jgi:hypothetical protein